MEKSREAQVYERMRTFEIKFVRNSVYYIKGAEASGALKFGEMKATTLYIYMEIKSVCSTECSTSAKNSHKIILRAQNREIPHT